MTDDKVPENEDNPLEAETVPQDLPVVNMPSTPVGIPEYVTVDMFNELQLELHQLRAEFVRLRNQVEAIDEPADGNS